MWEKLKNDKYTKALLTKLITVLVIASIALLVFDVMTKSNDGRRQIVDEDGGTEYVESTETNVTPEERRLKEILCDISGVGDVDVMITYKGTGTSAVFSSEEKKVTSDVEGVIVTATGAKDIIIRNNITRAVSAIFNIPASNVMVFEKKK